MLTNQEFFITLPSNVKSNTQFEYNTISNYKTTLNTRFDLPQSETWRVGLAEIGYTKSWYNLRNRVQVEFYGKDGNPFLLTLEEEAATVKYHNSLKPKPIQSGDVNKDTVKIRTELTFHASIFINPGYYKNCEELVLFINGKLKEMSNYCDLNPYFIFDKFDHHVTLIPGMYDGSYFFPYFGLEIESILGLVDNKTNRTLFEMTKHNNTIASYDVLFEEAEKAWFDLEYRGKLISEINMGCRALYIYSNLVEHSFVGSSSVQLLRSVEVPDKKEFGDFVTIIYDKPHFHPLSTYSFDTIEIDIKDDTDTRIPFLFGRVTVKLVFRKDESRR